MTVSLTEDFISIPYMCDALKRNGSISHSAILFRRVVHDTPVIMEWITD
jgi:hypothetical protein